MCQARFAPQQVMRQKQASAGLQQGQCDQPQQFQHAHWPVQQLHQQQHHHQQAKGKAAKYGRAARCSRQQAGALGVAGSGASQSTFEQQLMAGAPPGAWAVPAALREQLGGQSLRGSQRHANAP